MDPGVASERKWDWGRTYYNLEGYISIYLHTQWPWIHGVVPWDFWYLMIYDLGSGKIGKILVPAGEVVAKIKKQWGFPWDLELIYDSDWLGNTTPISLCFIILRTSYNCSYWLLGFTDQQTSLKSPTLKIPKCMATLVGKCLYIKSTSFFGGHVKLRWES